ncbi:hypothetical protein T439DRAFT_357890 [Meredithblackwellia eburnea MCA 4105]
MNLGGRNWQAATPFLESSQGPRLTSGTSHQEGQSSIHEAETKIQERLGIDLRLTGYHRPHLFAGKTLAGARKDALDAVEGIRAFVGQRYHHCGGRANLSRLSEFMDELFTFEEPLLYPSPTADSESQKFDAEVAFRFCEAAVYAKELPYQRTKIVDCFGMKYDLGYRDIHETWLDHLVFSEGPEEIPKARATRPDHQLPNAFSGAPKSHESDLFEHVPQPRSVPQIVITQPKDYQDEINLFEPEHHPDHPLAHFTLDEAQAFLLDVTEGIRAYVGLQYVEFYHGKRHCHLRDEELARICCFMEELSHQKEELLEASFFNKLDVQVQVWAFCEQMLEPGPSFEQKLNHQLDLFDLFPQLFDNFCHLRDEAKAHNSELQEMDRRMKDLSLKDHPEVKSGWNAERKRPQQVQVGDVRKQARKALQSKRDKENQEEEAFWAVVHKLRTLRGWAAKWRPKDSEWQWGDYLKFMGALAEQELCLFHVDTRRKIEKKEGRPQKKVNAEQANKFLVDLFISPSDFLPPNSESSQSEVTMFPTFSKSKRGGVDWIDLLSEEIAKRLDSFLRQIQNKSTSIEDPNLESLSALEDVFQSLQRQLEQISSKGLTDSQKERKRTSQIYIYHFMQVEFEGLREKFSKPRHPPTVSSTGSARSLSSDEEDVLKLWLTALRTVRFIKKIHSEDLTHSKHKWGVDSSEKGPGGLTGDNHQPDSSVYFSADSHNSSSLVPTGDAPVKKNHVDRIRGTTETTGNSQTFHSVDLGLSDDDSGFEKIENDGPSASFHPTARNKRPWRK